MTNIKLNLLKLLGIFFIFNCKITLILILALTVQNPSIKIEILDIYSSGLFLNYKQIQNKIEKAIKFLLYYYMIDSIK